jgi:ABC-type phosphate transport system permease subunit
MAKYSNYYKYNGFICSIGHRFYILFLNLFLIQIPQFLKTFIIICFKIIWNSIKSIRIQYYRNNYNKKQNNNQWHRHKQKRDIFYLWLIILISISVSILGFFIGANIGPQSIDTSVHKSFILED